MGTYLRRKGDIDRWLSTIGPLFGFDTETTDLNYYRLEIEGCSFCDGEQSCYIDLVDNTQFRGIIDSLKQCIESAELVIMHNAPFDLKVLYKYGIEPKGVYCTMTAAHLLDENGPKGLKDLANTQLKIPKQMIKSYDEVERDTPEFYRYAENDAKWTWRLYQRQLPRLKKEGLDKLFWETEMPFQYVLRDLAILGMEVDLEKRDELYYNLRHDIFVLEHRLLVMCGSEYSIKRKRGGEIICEAGINFGSSKQLIDIAESKFGLEITERTKKGAKSFGKDTITRLAGHPFIDLLAKYKKAKKLMDGFIEPFKDYVDEDNRIRASFNNARPVTGRLSCSNPNLEQLPRNNDLCNVRDLFIAGEGKTLVVADYSGQELVVLAEETQDETLCDAIHNNKDIHLMVANQVFDLQLPTEAFRKDSDENVRAKDQWKDQRHGAKNGIVFPVVYGSTAYGIAKYFGITEEEANRYLNSFLDLYPGIRRRIEECKVELNRNEYVVDMFGRRRRFPGYRNMWKGHKARAERQAFNFLIQSPSATMIRNAANKVHQYNGDWIGGMNIVNIVHDELVIEVPEAYVEDFVEITKDLMTTDTGLSLPIGVEISYGRRYGECK